MSCRYRRPLMRTAGVVFLALGFGYLLIASIYPRMLVAFPVPADRRRHAGLVGGAVFVLVGAVFLMIG